MFDETDLLHRILIQTMNAQLKWSLTNENENTGRSYWCYDIYDSEISSVCISIYNDFISFMALFNDDTMKRYRADIPIMNNASINQVFLHALANVVEVTIRCQKLEKDAANELGGEEIAFSIILDILLSTSHNEYRWIKSLVTEEQFLVTDDPAIKKYIGHATNITKFQTSLYEQGTLNTYNFYHFQYDNSCIVGDACILEIKDEYEDEEYSIYADVNWDTQWGSREILYKLYDAVKQNCEQYDTHPHKQFELRLKKLLDYARSKRNCLMQNEVTSFFIDLNLDVKQIELVLDFLESNNVDVLQFSNEEDTTDVFQDQETKRSPANKYNTEEERLAVRKASRQKYQRKLNKSNEYMIDKTIEVAYSNPYAKLEDDMSFLQKILY